MAKTVTKALKAFQAAPEEQKGAALEELKEAVWDSDRIPVELAKSLEILLPDEFKGKFTYPESKEVQKVEEPTVKENPETDAYNRLQKSIEAGLKKIDERVKALETEPQDPAGVAAKITGADGNARPATTGDRPPNLLNKALELSRQKGSRITALDACKIIMHRSPSTDMVGTSMISRLGRADLGGFDVTPACAEFLRTGELTE